VHFQAITDRFSPHDTIFTISSSDDLNDHTLGAACSLHTAIPSTASSSGSSRKNRLDEITEDAEENQGGDGDDAQPAAQADSTPATKTEAPTIEIEDVSAPKSTESQTRRPPADARPITPATKASEPEPTAEDASETPKESDDNAPSTPLANSREFDYLYEPSEHRRFSSQTTRPSAADLYSVYYKPKVKLGPRPRPSLDMQRPQTSGDPPPPARLVSTLPAGMRIGPRKTNSSQRPKSRDSLFVPPANIPPPPPMPDVPEMSSLLPKRNPGSSAASVRSLPATMHRVPASPGVTPERQRLMKALELRKKQLSAQREKATKTEAIPSSPSDRLSSRTIAVAQPPKSPSIKVEEVVEDHKKLEEVKTEQSPADQKSQAPAVPAEHAAEETVKTDSGDDTVVTDSGETEEQASTNAASSPVSVQEELSTGHSTRPSSISGDEDHDSSKHEDEPSTDSQRQAAVPKLEVANGVVSPAVEVEESAESSPTIVPDRTSPAPSPVPSEGTEAPANRPQTIDSSDTEVPQQLEEAKKPEQIEEPELPEESEQSKQPEQAEQAEEAEQSEQSELSEQSERSNRRDQPWLGRARVESPLGAPPSSSPDTSRPSTGTKERLRVAIDPIRTSLSAENSDNDYLSDDSFMDELQSATVQEAMPVSVSKSPITPFFPRRTSSNSVAAGSHVMNMARSFSGSAVTALPAANESLQVTRNSKVSSGISQRIKALAEKSNRDSVASISPMPSPGDSSYSARRKSIVRPSSRNSVVSISTVRFNRMSTAAAPEPTFPQRLDSLKQTSQNAPPAVYKVHQQETPSESVSVTARIVRDDRTKKPDLTMPTDVSPLELHQSQITIDHHKSTVSLASIKSAIQPKPEPPVPAQTPSSPPSRDSQVPRTSSDGGWRTFGRRRGSETRPSPSLQDKSPSMTSIEVYTEDEKSADKKASRTSRLFKRVSSSISSASRKSIIGVISPPLKEDIDNEFTLLEPVREPPPSIQVGDLNVQFPDTLLWKRRWVEIDGQGNLVLATSKANDHKTGVTKRYHLTEFRPPYAPDLDRQELPNSMSIHSVVTAASMLTNHRCST
jgi:hypothetical protein